MANGQDTHQVDLQRLMLVVDTPKTSKDELTALVHTGGSYDGIDTRTWKEAIRYAYERLRPVMAELNILHTRVRELRSGSSSQNSDTSMGSDSIDEANVLMLDERWLEHASESQLRDRLVMVAYGRMSRDDAREALNSELRGFLGQ